MQGREDTLLNEKGKLQGELIGKYLKMQDWHVIVTSPLIRARETAEIIRKHTAINEISVMDEFIERDFGAASGLTRKEADERFPDGNIKDIESRGELVRRVMRGLDIILERYEDEKIIVVTHGAVINSVVSTVSRGAIVTTKPENGGISILCYCEGGWRCTAYNLSGHL
jgi:uncharacterized phosphatase